MYDITKMIIGYNKHVIRCNSILCILFNTKKLYNYNLIITK